MKRLTKSLLILITLLFASVGNLYAEEPLETEYIGITFNSYTVNTFDRLIMNPYSKPLDLCGSGLEVLTLLTPSVMFLAPVEDYWKIGIEYAETLALAYGAKELAKHLVSKARPYMYFASAPGERILDGDWANSFFSGHSTMSFAAASFTTVMLCQYFPYAEWKGAAIVGCYTLATATAAFRLLSGNHFLSDVIVGALVGSAIGFGVPLLNSIWFKPSRIGNADVAISPLGFNVQMKF